MLMKKIKIQKELLLFLSLVFAWLLFTVSLKTDTPIVIISSDSMQPAFNCGDIVFVKGTDIGSLEIGDIIVYNCPSKEYLCVTENQLIAHRIVEINKTHGIKTKGDANERQDRWLVRFSWINGKMFFKLPFVGKPVIALKQITGVL